MNKALIYKFKSYKIYKYKVILNFKRKKKVLTILVVYKVYI